ncbi:hypothetical protein TNCV_206931 [Trichonephila clavipes]|nr:hypothetical protein TNCV_206931 [Trichonephila clavipes]
MPHINCHFPTQWKIANVVMLPKVGQDHKFPQRLRPISLLNCTAKIFERIILNRIKAHCKAIDCIPPGTMRVPGGPFYATPIDTCQ